MDRSLAFTFSAGQGRGTLPHILPGSEPIHETGIKQFIDRDLRSRALLLKDQPIGPERIVATIPQIAPQGDRKPKDHDAARDEKCGEISMHGQHQNTCQNKER